MTGGPKEWEIRLFHEWNPVLHTMKHPWMAMLVGCSLISSGCFGTEGSAELDPYADDDGDGLPNGWEEEHGLDPLNASDSLLCHGKAE